MSESSDRYNEEDTSPLSFLGSAAGDAYFSGVGMAILFEAIDLTHSTATGTDHTQFKRLNDVIGAAVHAKDDLDAMVKNYGNRK